jgi:hypothetical protein
LNKAKRAGQYHIETEKRPKKDTQSSRKPHKSPKPTRKLKKVSSDVIPVITLDENEAIPIIDLEESGDTSCYNKCNSVGLNLVCEATGLVEFPGLSIPENCDTTSREVPIIIVTPPSPCEADDNCLEPLSYNRDSSKDTALPSFSLAFGSRHNF